MSQSPQLKVSKAPEARETGLCCVYNATRDCRLNSSVTVADSVRDPLKVLKVLIEGLARDGKSGLWLTPLVLAPNLTRLFPFDFAYLDGDCKVMEAGPLAPGMPLPQFNSRVASALILPLDTFTSTGTHAGDRLIICEPAELEARIAEVSVMPIDVLVAAFEEAPDSAKVLPLSHVLKAEPDPDRGLRGSLPVFAGLPTQGTRSTLAMSATWQISGSTTTAVLAEQAHEAFAVQEEEAAGLQLGLLETEVEESEISVVSEQPAAGELASVEPVNSDLAPAPSPATAQNCIQADEAKVGAADTATPIEPIVEQIKTPVDVPVAQKKGLPQREAPRQDVAPVPDGPVKAGKGEKEKKKKESLGVLVKRFLNCEDPLPERRSIIRLLSKELVAGVTNGELRKLHDVRDVSPTGLYLRTDERWEPGQVVSLTVQRRDYKDGDHERRVRVKVKAVRRDQGGVGMSWVWPEGVEFQPWNRLHTKRSDDTDADYFLRELRLTGALAFLQQICPSALEEIKLALHQRLSNKRVASAVEITLKAQELLSHGKPLAHPLAHPDMVRRILENGSWIVDDWIREWWAGLLVSSCGTDGLNTSNSVFIDLLAKLTPVHLRVLRFVCGRDSECAADIDVAQKQNSYCTADELIEAVGSQSLARIQQTMGQLSSLGLLAEIRNPSYVAVTDKGKTRIEPTELALKMYARCNGRQ